MPQPRPGCKGAAALLGWVVLGLWLLGVVASARGASVTARLDRETVPVGESVNLSLTFDGVAPGGTPNLPALPNLNLVSTTESSEFSIGAGQTISRKTFNYTLVPTKAGEITIPSLQIQLGGQTFTTQPLKLRVLPGGAGQTAEVITNLAFLRLVAPKTEVYLGEAFPVELQLYWQNAENVQMPQLPAEGFSLSRASRPTQGTTVVGGRQYNLAVFKWSAIPAKAGWLTLGPAECSLTVLVPQANARRRSPFDDPFGFFGPRMQGRPTVLQSEAKSIHVLPLPTENVPANFSGAVGSYTLALSAGPTNLAVGDPITVKIQIAGQGPLESVALPDQPHWRDFKTYPATSKVEPADALGLSGVKSFEQVVIPQNHEIAALPAFQFSFFDPAARAYRTLSSAPVPLTVRATAAQAPPPVLAATNANPAPPPVDDIVHIRARLEPGPRAGRPWLQQRWFLGWQAAPVLVWLGLLLARKRGEALANNPRLRRQRQVARRVREGLREMQGLAAERKSEEFFAALFHLLQEQLGERLDLPASAITEAVIEERLQQRELPAETPGELRELFQACNLARYAPLKTSQELASFIPRLDKVLRQLQGLK